MALKMKARTFARRGVKRSDWREIAVDVMRFCLNHKYQNSKVLRNMLERSKGKYIVEDESNRRMQPDLWGVVLYATTNEDYSNNIMVRLLMELREKGVIECEFSFDEVPITLPMVR